MHAHPLRIGGRVENRFHASDLMCCVLKSMLEPYFVN